MSFGNPECHLDDTQIAKSELRIIIMINLPYESRRAAGRILGECLNAGRSWTDPLVLALPRGGVPVGVAVAESLGAELDVILVRMLELPGGVAELTIGSVATGGITLRNESVIQAANVQEQEFLERKDLEMEILRRSETLYRGVRPRPPVVGRSVILVDDGICSAAKLRTAVRVLQRGNPAEVVVAAPVGSSTAVASLWREADEVFCPATPDPFLSIGLFYQNYIGVSDQEVSAMLQAAWFVPRLMNKGGVQHDSACII